ncbi:hypothetical protein Btru_014309 [Bulinus truncatus]|nr:hypothetical protein Btru_014309 [Bulinus truncatus]
MMASSSKHTEWILETIDHLRRRKARPDLERICHVVRRRFGLSAAETEAKLEKLVDAETVIKVDYKGSTSYRNAAKWRKSMLGCAVLNSTSVSVKIIEAILDISKAQISAIEANQAPSDGGAEEPALSSREKVAQYATEVGVSLDSLSSWLKDRCDGFSNLKSPLTVVLKREIDAGRVERLMSCNYVITPAQMADVDEIGVRPLRTVRKSSDPKTDTSSDDQLTPVARNSFSDESSNDLKLTIKVEPVKVTPAPQTPLVPQTPHQPARRGRPPKNRSQGPNAPGASTATNTNSHSKVPVTYQITSRVVGRGGKARVWFSPRNLSPDSGYSPRNLSPDSGYSPRNLSPDSGYSPRNLSPDNGYSPRNLSPDNGYSPRNLSPDNGYSPRNLSPDNGYSPKNLSLTLATSLETFPLALATALETFPLTLATALETFPLTVATAIYWTHSILIADP